MDRDEFMEFVYETFADESDNVLANGIIEAADAYVEHEKAQLSQEGSREGTTSELISRQAAIKKRSPQERLIIAKTLIEGVLDELPSAQPEPEHTMEEFMYGQDLGSPEDGSL